MFALVFITFVAKLIDLKIVLILAYDFPPYVSVGGLRPYSWYKYFHEFGIYPVVVTRQWGNKYGNHLDYIASGESDKTIIEETEYGTILRSPYKPNLSNRLLLKYGEKRFRLLRKAITAWYEFMQFLFFVGPKAGLYRCAKEYLKKNKVDTIIATGEPFILFKYASKLSGKFNIPWLADYRDPWTQSAARSKNVFLKKWNSFFEIKCLNNAFAITTVSELLKYQIKLLLPNKFIHIIPNGYSLPAEFNMRSQSPNNDKLRLAFAGSIYAWHPWKVVLHSLLRLKQNNNGDFEFAFYGINAIKEIKAYLTAELPQLKKHIKFYPKLGNQELLYELSMQHVLLLFNDYTIAGTKIYDYLSVKRRILLCFTKDDNALQLKSKYFPLKGNDQFNTSLQQEIIEHTKSGYAIENSESLVKLLTGLQTELKESQCLICNSIHIENYDRKKQVEHFAQLLI